MKSQAQRELAEKMYVQEGRTYKEIGIILDVVLGALVMGILLLRVRSSVDTDIADLENLKG